MNARRSRGTSRKPAERQEKAGSEDAVYDKQLREEEETPFRLRLSSAQGVRATGKQLVPAYDSP